MLHRGYDSISVYDKFLHDLAKAAQSILTLLYRGLEAPQEPISNKTAKKDKRNDEIRARYAAGDTIPELAKAFSISEQRVHQIVHYKRK